MLKDMFKKTYTLIDTKYKGQTREPNIPEGLWRKCRKCGQPVYRDDVVDSLYTCPKCKAYFRVHAFRRIEITADKGSFEEWDSTMEFGNPLDFPGYEDKVREAREKTRLNEAVVTGTCLINGEKTALGVCDSRFLMSSMGHVVGEKITRMVERATAQRLPVIIFACSGGARMQEGCVSLMQMAKTSGALKRHHEAGLLFVSVLTDPTTGGVTASFAMLGDVILAEPGALIGFAGPRVIQQTIGQKLPEGFQRSEFLLDHGFVDRIVPREEMKDTLGKLLRMHRDGGVTHRDGCCGETAGAKFADMVPVNGTGQSGDDGRLSGKNENVGETVSADGGNGAAVSGDAGKAEGEHGAAGKAENSRAGDTLAGRAGSVSAETAGRSFASGSLGDSRDNEFVSQKTAWEHVQLSRRADRPTALDYIEEIFDEFMELHGDRYFGDDGAIVGGLAMFHGQAVTVIGQQKGKTTKENISRNFGMPSPEGYRKALRLMKQAERFGRPVICFVDTPGAFCGIEAEERGQGEAIARNLFELSDLKVPVLSIVIGEGGSGGALAMAVANEVWMMENAIYSVLSPEGFASILWKDSKRAQEAAGVMKITAGDLLKLNIIDRVIPEREPACGTNLKEIAGIMEERIYGFLEEYERLGSEELQRQRYDRFCRI